MLRQFTLNHLITLLYLWQAQTEAAFAIAAAALIGAMAVLGQTAATGRRSRMPFRPPVRPRATAA
jgi:uncharacterized membrane protein